MVLAKLRCLALLLQELSKEPVSKDGAYTIEAHPVEMALVRRKGSSDVIQDSSILRKVLYDYSEYTVCEYRHAEPVMPMMFDEDCLVLSEHKMKGIFACTVHGDASGAVVIDTYEHVIVGENDEVVGSFVSIIKAL